MCSGRLHNTPCVPGRRAAFNACLAGGLRSLRVGQGSLGVAAQVPSSQNQGFKPKDPNSEAPKPKSEHKMVLRQISCCQVKQVWKILIQRSRSEARPYILLLIHFILLFSPSISPLLIEYFMAFLMGEMSRWTLFTKLTTSP